MGRLFPSLALVCLCGLALLSVTVHGQSMPPYTVSYYPSLIDHFTTITDGQQPATFQQKILICSEFYQPNSTAPVLFYTGNEGDIEDFYSNTGSGTHPTGAHPLIEFCSHLLFFHMCASCVSIIFDWAATLNALVVFAEHRYYGESLPFGNSSLSQENIQFLTIQQATEDYAIIINYLQAEYGLTGANAVPWIAVGGSYGGVLSAWMRYRYPSLIAGAIAASAPIKYLSTELDFSFFAAATQDYAAIAPGCEQTVRDGYEALEVLIAAGDYASIQAGWNLCAPPTPDTIEHLRLWSVNALLSLAQFDYPYPASFSGSPLPGYPVNVACSILTNPTLTPFEALGQAVGLFFNDSLTCFDPASEFIECADQTGCGLGNDATAWNFQVCSQFVYLPNTNNITDMFPAHSFTLDDLTAYCQTTFGVTPDPTALNLDFGGQSILETSSNIVFSNGNLDPYRAGGFLPSEKLRTEVAPGVFTQHVGGMDSSIVLLLIEDGAHHLDLRASNPLDPQSVTQARDIELKNIQQWIAQFPSATKPTGMKEVAQPVEATESLFDQTQVVSHPTWKHQARAAKDQLVSFKIALKHGDAAGISSLFDRVFNPEHKEYLHYPSAETVAAMMSPPASALAAVDEWIRSSVCAGAASCEFKYPIYKDSVKITMDVASMEKFLGGNTELHVYQKAGSKRTCVRTNLPTLEHLIPAHILPAVSHITGLTDFPPEIKAHIARAGERKMDVFYDSTATPALLPTKQVTAGMTVAEQFEATRAQMNQINSHMRRYLGANQAGLTDSLQNTILTVAQLSTGDLSITAEFIIFCSLNPPTAATYITGSAYCMFSNNLATFQSIDILVTDPSGLTTTTNYDNSALQYQPTTSGADLPLIIASVPLNYNYVGYSLQFNLNFDIQTIQTTYPFKVSGAQNVHPNFIKGYVGVPAGFQATTFTSRLGIGALGDQVSNGIGFYSPSDLTQFWSENNLPLTPQVKFSADTYPYTNDPTNPDGETQLDIQFGLGLLAQSSSINTPANLYHSNDENSFDDIVNLAIADTNSKVSVLSFSYGGWEGSNATANTHTDVKFQAAGLAGISMFVSSGDTGAFQQLPTDSTMGEVCAQFRPSYPATSPYVTSVGASVLKTNTINTCPYSVQSSVEFGALITGGGGFSAIEPQPAYQTSMVNAWVDNTQCPKPTVTLYDYTKRGYPDLVLFGHNYDVVMNGADGGVDGTSASSPSLAGIIGFFNGLRTAQGNLQPLGFLNPLLYQAAVKDPRTFTDITEGTNKCLERGMGCCSDGYTACPSWDPVTGLGTPNFQYLQAFFNVTAPGKVDNSTLICSYVPYINNNPNNKSNHTAAIVGGVLGGLAVFAVVVFCCCRRRTVAKAPLAGMVYYNAGSPQPVGGTMAQPPAGYAYPPQQGTYQPPRPGQQTQGNAYGRL